MTQILPFERPSERSTERWAEGPTITASIWRYRWLVLAVSVVAGLAGLFLSQLQPAVYEASSRLFLTSPGTAGVFERQATIPLDRYLPQQAQRASSTETLASTAELVDDDLTARELAEKVEVTTDLDLVTLRITVQDESAQRAADIANAIATTYEDSVRQAQLARVDRAVSELDRTAEAIEEQIDELAAATDADGELPAGQAGQIGVLTQRLVEISTLGQQLLVDARLFGSGVEFVEFAEPPTTPVSPRPNRTAAVALVLGGLLASALAYWLAGRARPVVSRDDPAEILGVPLLGILPTYEVPEVGTLAQRTGLEPRTNEAYRFVYSSLVAILDEQAASSVMFTSASPGAGKTETALQIAATASRRGKKTLLIDADLRMQGLSSFLRADRIPGLADLAEPSASHQADSLILPYEIDGQRHLDVLTAGRTVDPSGDHLSESWFGHAFAEAVSDYDLAIVDSPPLLAVADTATIAGYSDAIVLVVREGSDLDELERVRGRLRFVRQRLVGYVYLSPSALNDTSFDYGLARNRSWGELSSRPKKLVGMQSQDDDAKVDETADVYQRWFGGQGPPPTPPKDPRSQSRGSGT